MAYAALEPFGEGREDFRAGQICSTVANYAGKVRNEDAPSARPEDFMPALAEGMVKANAKTSGPILLDDPVEQAKLFKAMIFKVPQNG